MSLFLTIYPDSTGKKTLEMEPDAENNPSSVPCGLRPITMYNVEFIREKKNNDVKAISMYSTKNRLRRDYLLKINR